jgi:hypothetical protein
MTTPYTLQGSFHVGREAKGRRTLTAGRLPAAMLSGRVPRIARLLALALRFEKLMASGSVSGYAELARLGQVSRARISQIMNLLLLAVDIQEQILSLPRVTRGRDPVHVQQLQGITLQPDWAKQRLLWQKLLVKCYPAGLAAAKNC